LLIVETANILLFHQTRGQKIPSNRQNIKGAVE